MATRLLAPRSARPRKRKRTTGTPPEDVHRVEAGLLARGSSLPSGLPGLTPSGAEWTLAHRSQLGVQRRHCRDRV